MNPKPFFFISIFLFAFLFSPAQKKTILKRCPVKTINYEQGLLYNGTTDIITDVSGFTWVSTQTGMQRYNGYVLETIKPVVNRQVININAPVNFFALQNKMLWISYRYGVLEYNPFTNSFRKIIALANEDSLNFSLIPVRETVDGIWCLKNKTGIVLYSTSGVLLKNISKTTDQFVQYVFNEQNANDYIKFTNNSNSIFLYNGKNMIEIFSFKTKQSKYFSVPVFNSFACSRNTLYLVSATDIKLLNLQTCAIEKDVQTASITGEVINNTTAYWSPKNQLYVGLNGRLFYFDSACNYLGEFTDLNHNAVVSVGFIRFIYCDNFKRIWLLTNDDIKRIEDFDIPFEHLIYAGEKNNFVRSLYFDEQKHVLIAGCYNGGLQLFDSAGNALWKQAVAMQKIKDINAIEKIGSDEYLVETIGSGWYIFHFSSKTLTPVILDNNEKNKINIYAINFLNNLQRINDSTVLIACENNVFNCVFRDGKLITVKSLLPVHNNTSEQINCCLYDANKNLWAGTNTGVIYRLSADKKLTSISIPGNFHLRSLAEDVDHNIWAGTDKGLYVYNNSGRLIKTITVETGLLNDCIYALLPLQNKPGVFASSNLGLSYIALNEKIVNYTKESGLQENEFNTEASVKTKNGKLYFGGINGTTAFYPSALSSIIDTPALNVVKFIVNDSVYNNTFSAQKNNIIKLNYKQNHILLSFAALGILNADEYEYIYRLTGFEKKWQTTHEPKDIKYVLQPGSYSFDITCSPVFSSKTIFKKTIEIIILPPWWETWWFKILVAALFIFIIVIILQQYNKRKYIRKINAMQLQQELQHERERISRDLHDNLGAYAAAIAANVASIQNKSEYSDINILHQLKDNSQSIITQLHDTIWTLNKKEISLTSISDHFKIFLQKIQPNYPDIQILIQEEILNDQTLSPSNVLHLFRIMQECVSNALRHSGCSTINIKISSNETWSVVISDNGKGFSKDKMINGNGLKNIKWRGEEAGWKITWNKVSEGTTITISNSQ
ncbi:MAG: hypothetical protein JST21_03590 [Bacteroidetes bacterium]|nr:hypothetical protein [Bacteroidota bacterium]